MQKKWKATQRSRKMVLMETSAQIGGSGIFPSSLPSVSPSMSPSCGTIWWNSIPGGITCKWMLSLSQEAIQEIAKEELKIRQNISARNTTLLQKVFGYADRNK